MRRSPLRIVLLLACVFLLSSCFADALPQAQPTARSSLPAPLPTVAPLPEGATCLRGRRRARPFEPAVA
jgi:hypothetical protein